MLRRHVKRATLILPRSRYLESSAPSVLSHVDQV